MKKKPKCKPVIAYAVLCYCGLDHRPVFLLVEANAVELRKMYDEDSSGHRIVKLVEAKR